MDEDQMSDADLWEHKVDSGMSEAQATAYVRARHAAPQAAGPEPAWKRALRMSANVMLNRPVMASENPEQRDVDRMGLQGATFGFGDELAGLGAAIVPGGRNYTQARDASRANVARIRRERPRTALAAEMLGGAVVPIGGGAGVGASVLRSTGSRVLASAAGGLVAGGAGGALNGAGNADGDLADRARGAEVGGATGAVTGAMLGGLGSVAARVAGRLRGRATARAVDTAAATLRRELSAAGLTPATAVQRATEMGPGAVVADLSPSLARAARTARNLAPEVDAVAGPVERIRMRTAATPDRVAGAVREASGLTQTYPQSLAAAEHGVRDVRTTHYGPLEQAFPEISGPNVDRILADPRYEAARRAAGIGGGAEGLPLLSSGQRPAFRQMQDFLIHLRDDVSAATTAGRPGQAQRARELYEAARQAMEQDVPGFAQAQQAYHVATSTRDAHELGRSLFNRPPHEIEAAMAELPPEAHDAFRQGLLDAVEVPLGNREGMGGVGAYVRPGPTTAAKLRLVAGDNGRFDRLMSVIRNRERPFSITATALDGNSTTGMQLADADAMMREIPTSTQGIVSRLVDLAVGPNSADRQAAASHIAHVLLAEGPEAAYMLAHQLRARPVIAGMFGAAAGSAAGGAMAGQPQQ